LDTVIERRLLFHEAAPLGEETCQYRDIPRVEPQLGVVVRNGWRASSAVLAHVRDDFYVCFWVLFLRHRFLVHVGESFWEERQGAEAFVACLTGVTWRESVINDVIEQGRIAEISEGSCLARFSKNADRTVSRDALSGSLCKSAQIFGTRCLSSLHASPQYPINRQVSGSESFLADSLGLSRSTWDCRTVLVIAMSLS
jgi:hypothetical protein